MVKIENILYCESSSEFNIKLYFGKIDFLLATIIIFVFNYLQRNTVLFKCYLKNSSYI